MVLPILQPHYSLRCACCICHSGLREHGRAPVLPAIAPEAVPLHPTCSFHDVLCPAADSPSQASQARLCSSVQQERLALTGQQLLLWASLATFQALCCACWTLSWLCAAPAPRVRSWLSTGPSGRCPTLCWVRTRLCCQTFCVCAPRQTAAARWSWCAGGEGGQGRKGSPVAATCMSYDAPFAYC